MSIQSLPAPPPHQGDSRSQRRFGGPPPATMFGTDVPT